MLSSITDPVVDQVITTARAAARSNAQRGLHAMVDTARQAEPGDDGSCAASHTASDGSGEIHLSAVTTSPATPGWPPAPRDSGSRVGKLRRPRRDNRQLLRVFYTSAMISVQRSPASHPYYQREGAEVSDTARPSSLSLAAA